MNDIREQISLTQQLVRETNASFKSFTQERLNQPERYIQPGFIDLARDLGYQSTLLSGSRKLSLSDVSLVGYISKNPLEYYQAMYQHFVEGADERYTPYFDAMQAKNRPVFERFFRARGLKPVCEVKRRSKCDKWTWEEQSNNSAVNQAIAHQRAALEFVIEYSDFISNPDQFSPERLQYTSDIFNGILQDTANTFQRDIEEFLIRPTVRNIQIRTAKEKKVSFAQVGRTTISTLSGVPTEVKSETQSAVQFNNQQPQSLSELLVRAKELESSVQGFIPTVSAPDNSPEEIDPYNELELEAGGDTRNSGSSRRELARVGPIPASQIIGLIAAASEDQSKPAVLKTGTNLVFTPGVLRDLNSAELNIELTITSPSLTSTAESDLKEPEGVSFQQFSRIGEQKIKTSVYTQASDFFDLSTFTSQATLNGGRGYLPIIGKFWRSIFGNTPVLGRLFSFQKNSQSVLHESLLLTNSSIRPTPLGIGLIYKSRGGGLQPRGSNGQTINPYTGENLCITKIRLHKYIDELQPGEGVRAGQIYLNRSKPAETEDSQLSEQIFEVDRNELLLNEHLLSSADRARCLKSSQSWQGF